MMWRKLGLKRMCSLIVFGLKLNIEGYYSKIMVLNKVKSNLMVMNFFLFMELGEESN